MRGARVDALPRWPGYLLGALAGMAITFAGEIAGHLLATDIPSYLTTLDEAHDIDL